MSQLFKKKLEFKHFLTSGIVDSSGYEFTYTADPPIHEAGILIVGYPVDPFMIIPPNIPSFNVTGTCISDCTTSVSY